MGKIERLPKTKRQEIAEGKALMRRGIKKLMTAGYGAYQTVEYCAQYVDAGRWM